MLFYDISFDKRIESMSDATASLLPRNFNFWEFFSRALFYTRSCIQIDPVSGKDYQPSSFWRWKEESIIFNLDFSLLFTFPFFFTVPLPTTDSGGKFCPFLARTQITYLLFFPNVFMHDFGPHASPDSPPKRSPPLIHWSRCEKTKGGILTLDWDM